MMRPKTVQNAFILYLVVMLLSVISSVINIGALPEGQSVTVYVIASVIFTALFLWLGYLIYQGKNWARIFFIVISLFGFVMTYGVAHEGIHHDAVRYLTWLQSTLTVAIILLLLMPRSNAWFSKRESE